MKIHRTGVPVGDVDSPEFRADAVALYHASPGGTCASVAKDLGVNHETLRTWVRDAEQTAQPGPAGLGPMPSSLSGSPGSTRNRTAPTGAPRVTAELRDGG
ncbi:transposase-like protein [Streptomyces sp. TE33382]